MYEEEEINILDLFIYVLKKAKTIIIFALCTCLLTCGLMFVVNAFSQKDENNFELESLRKRLDYFDEYRENSLYINMNPYKEYVTTTILEIYGIKLISNLDANDMPEYLSSMSNDITRKYISKFNSNNLSNYIDGVEDLYIRELVTVYSDGALIVVVAKSDEETISNNLSSKVSDSIISDYEIINESVKHKIRKLNSSSTIVVDQKAIEARENFEKEYKEVEKSFNKLNGKNSIKYAAIGFVGGGFVVCCYYAVEFIILGLYMSSNSLEDESKIKCLGTLQIKDNKNRIFNRLSKERVFDTKEEALNYIKNNLDLEIDKKEKTLVTSSLKIEKEEVKELLDILGNNIVFESDYYHNPMVAKTLKNVKNVVLFEKTGVTSISKVKNIKKQLEELDVKVKGFVEV